MPVEVQGLLRLDGPTGRSIDVVADGNRLHVAIPGWTEFRSTLPSSWKTRRQLACSIARALEAAGLTLNVESAGNTIFRMGHGTAQNWLARLAGLTSTQVAPALLLLPFRR